MKWSFNDSQNQLLISPKAEQYAQLVKATTSGLHQQPVCISESSKQENKTLAQPMLINNTKGWDQHNAQHLFHYTIIRKKMFNPVHVTSLTQEQVLGRFTVDLLSFRHLQSLTLFHVDDYHFMTSSNSMPKASVIFFIKFFYPECYAYYTSDTEPIPSTTKQNYVLTVLVSVQS